MTALATSGHRRYVDSACKSAGIPRRFQAEVTGDMVEHGKPAPDTFLVACNLLGIAPKRALVLEDSPQGIEAAIAAGSICFAVPDHHAGQVDVSHADRVLESLFDVFEAVSGYELVSSKSSQG